jgi:photosystem II stability/assembly factor-like uncharacterized protein
MLAAAALHWTPQVSNSTASLRGLSVVSQKVVWASGSKGTVLRTLDGGGHWEIRKVPGAEALDFRDVEAFDGKTALVMASGTGENSRVYLTTNGGELWTLVLGNPDKDGFFDAMKFWNRQQGILLGDPVAGRFTIFTTEDGGLNWIKANQPAAASGEGAFAASGTCLTVHGGHDVWFGTGGSNVARVFHSADNGQSWAVASTPLAGSTAASGIFSLVFIDAQHGVAVGGDYQKPTDAARTLALSNDGGHTWTAPAAGIPSGYRSAVTYVKPSKMLVAVGTSGSDYSLDAGLTWQRLSGESLNAAANDADHVWAVGPKGLILKLAFR